MKAIGILFPVFFMMFLGVLSRTCGWITREQNEGAKKIIFSVLFPILIFDVIVKAQIGKRFLLLIVFADAVWILIYLIGKAFVPFTGKRFGDISPFLLLTCEGGSVALPLYLTLVGEKSAVHIVTFDVAGVLINFIFVPILVMRKASGKVETKALLGKVIRSSFLIAVILGIVVNLSGAYRFFMTTEIGSLYSNTVGMVLQPITGMILFALGYDLKIDREMLQPLFKLALIRLILCSGIIILFYLIFPSFVEEKAFQIAILLYFMCPTGFPVPLQVMPLVRDSEDEHFMSAFLSLFMVIALVAYTLLVIFVV